MNLCKKRFQVTRTYYRNNFFHAGHLKTILDNERYAKKYNGICYAIIDDRQDSGCFSDITDNFKYLELKHVKIISVKQYYRKIMEYTEDLIRKGAVYLCHSIMQEHNTETILRLIKNPVEHFQIRLKCGMGNENPSIGYTHGDKNGLKLTLIFDYIIKVLDQILGVTDVINTTSAEMSDIKSDSISLYFDSIGHHWLGTYRIDNFKYSKRGWNVNDEANPYLLTFKGLRSRHIPALILKAFYIHACQTGHVSIKYLSDVLNTYLRHNSVPVFGVIKPVEVKILDWIDKRTEYVCTSNKVGAVQHHPLNGAFYVDNQDVGMDRKINVGKPIYLQSGPTFMCKEIVNVERSVPVIKASCTDLPKNYRMSVNWVSSSWDSEPCMVRFYLYNWFYTGFNELLEPEISDGYIDQNVFRDLEAIYYIKSRGYFKYDRLLSSINCIPTFLRICK